MRLSFHFTSFRNKPKEQGRQKAGQTSFICTQILIVLLSALLLQVRYPGISKFTPLSFNWEQEKTKHKYLWSLIFKGFVTLSISPGLLPTQMLKSLEWECAFTWVRDVCSVQPADVYREKSCGGWGWALRKLQNWAWVPWWSRTELLVTHSSQKDERNIFLNGSHVTSCGNDKFSQLKTENMGKKKKAKI